MQHLWPSDPPTPHGTPSAAGENSEADDRHQKRVVGGGKFLGELFRLRLVTDHARDPHMPRISVKLLLSP